MQTKRTIIAMIVMMALVFVWQPVTRWVLKTAGYDTSFMDPKPALPTINSRRSDGR